MPRVLVTILGGLPVVADVSFGRSSYDGEYWAEVDALYWRRKDGTAGRKLPQHIVDRVDDGCVIEQANDFLAGPPEDEEPDGQLLGDEYATQNQD